jgi:hypothetical protein
MARNTGAQLAATISALAVVIGIGSSCGGSTDAAPDFSVTADTAAATTLGTQVTIHVHLASTGVSGPVTLTLTGADSTWTVTPPALPVNLTANGQASADVMVTIPSDGNAAPTGTTLTVDAVTGTHDHTATSLVTVANQFIIPIRLGATVGGTHWGVPSADTIRLRIGTQVLFRDDDSSGHIIHANPANIGLAHQGTSSPIFQGGTYAQSVTLSGLDRVTCHSHPTDTLVLYVP